MNKVLLIASTDWHLKRDNLAQIKQLVSDQCQLADQLQQKNIFCLGDIFDSRISQRQEVLIAFYEILEIIRKAKKTLVCIPGNHDKTDYNDEASFLRPFRTHSALKLIENYEKIEISDITVHCIPYFDETGTYKKYLNQVKLGEKNILLSHIAVTGSVNNDGTKVENVLTPLDFKKFDAVFLGHYHNYQEISPNITHIPSIQQNNFGEDVNKGYTVIKTDLSFNIVPGKFKPYKRYYFDLTDMDTQSIDEIVDGINTEEVHAQLYFLGNQSEIKALNLSAYKKRGFAVQVKQKEIINSVEKLKEQDFKIYDIEMIYGIFKEYCEIKKINYTEGKQFLEVAIQNSLRTEKYGTS